MSKFRDNLKRRAPKKVEHLGQILDPMFYDACERLVALQDEAIPREQSKFAIRAPERSSSNPMAGNSPHRQRLIGPVSSYSGSSNGL